MKEETEARERMIQSVLWGGRGNWGANVFNVCGERNLDSLAEGEDHFPKKSRAEDTSE